MIVLKALGQATVVLGCSIVWLGTKIGGYNLRVAVPAGFSTTHQSQGISLALGAVLVVLAADAAGDIFSIVRFLFRYV